LDLYPIGFTWCELPVEVDTFLDERRVDADQVQNGRGQSVLLCDVSEQQKYRVFFLTVNEKLPRRGQSNRNICATRLPCLAILQAQLKFQVERTLPSALKPKLRLTTFDLRPALR